MGKLIATNGKAFAKGDVLLPKDDRITPLGFNFLAAEHLVTVKTKCMNTKKGIEVEYFLCDKNFNYKKRPAVIQRVSGSIVSVRYINEKGIAEIDENVRNADFIRLGFPFWKHIAQAIPKEMFLHPES